MCGRYTLGIRGPGEFDARFGGRVDVRALHRYNVAPTEAVPVVRGAREGGPAERTTVNAHWGLLPPWATSRSERLKPINARVETIAQKKLFAPLIGAAEHRVLVLAEGTIVESGPLHEVLRNPQHPDTKAMAESVPEVVAGRPPR